MQCDMEHNAPRLSDTALSGSDAAAAAAAPLDSGAGSLNSCLAVLEGHRKSAKVVLLPPHPWSRLFSAGADGVLCVWSTHSWAYVAALEGHTGGVLALALALGPEPPVEDEAASVHPGALPPGSLLFSAGEDGAVRVWDANVSADGAQDALVAVLRGHKGAVHALALLPSSPQEPHGGPRRRTVIVSAGADASCRVWALDASGGGVACLAMLRGHAGPVFGLRVLPAGDQQHLVTSSHDATVRLYDLSSALALEASTNGMALAYQQSASAQEPGLSVTPIRTLSGHEFAANAALVATPDAAFVFSCSNDATVRKWHLASGTCAAVLSGHSRSVTCLALSADGTALYSAGADGDVRAWRALDGSLRLRMAGHKGGIYALALAQPGGGALFSAGYDDTIRGWHAGDGHPLVLLRGHSAMVTCLVLSPDGGQLYSSSADTTVRAWSVPQLPGLPPFGTAPVAPPPPAVVMNNAAAAAEVGQLSAFVTAMSMTAQPSVSPAEMVTLKPGRDGKSRVTAAHKAEPLVPRMMPQPPAPPPAPAVEEAVAAPSSLTPAHAHEQQPYEDVGQANGGGYTHDDGDDGEDDAYTEIAGAEHVEPPIVQSPAPPPLLPAFVPGVTTYPAAPAAVRPHVVQHTQLLGGTLRPRGSVSGGGGASGSGASGRLRAPSGSTTSPTYLSYNAPGGAFSFAMGSSAPSGLAQGVDTDGMDFAARVALARSSGVAFEMPNIPRPDSRGEYPSSGGVPALGEEYHHSAGGGEGHGREHNVGGGGAIMEGNGSSDQDFVARLTRARSSGTLSNGGAAPYA